MTRDEALALEAEFLRQDKQVPMPSSFIEHLDNLEFHDFPEVTEDTPLDASVEIQRAGLSRIPAKLSLKKVIEKEIEPPV